MVKKIFILTFFLFDLYSCNVQKSSQFRFLKKEPFLQKNLRLDGYYYNNSYIDRYFFYKNGKVLFAFSCSRNVISECESDFSTNNFLESIKDTNNIKWTNYQVRNTIIVLERIYPAQDYPHHILSGHILNDSTFMIEKNKKINGKEETLLRDTFHFKEFHPKPDNSFESN